MKQAKRRQIRSAVRSGGIKAAALSLWLVATGALPAQAYVETPELQSRVEANALPPVEERLPLIPMTVDMPVEGMSIGRHGGTLDMLIPRSKSIRYMTLFGYARLVGYDRNFRIRADILERVDVEDERVYTLHLREGHRWSDGHPFTSEDFRYYWEDVALNPELSPSGPLSDLLAAGVPPRVDILDAHTVRYVWPKPHPTFLSLLAQARPPFIYRPAHYLKQFHARYADPDKLQDEMEREGVRNWAALHNRLDNMYKNDNPALPTLQPWVNTTDSPANRFVMKRNPYFHRVDAEGRQLPYIDEVVLTVAASRLIPAKTITGESDLQALGLDFSHVGILKRGERTGGYRLDLWHTTKSAAFALYPNLNVNDPVYRALFREARFRRALSLGIDRHGINRTLFFGLATAGGNTVLEASPLFDPANRAAWAGYDIAEANRLLDSLGLSERSSRGWRLMPDGRSLELIVETPGESDAESDLLLLLGESWRELGIKLVPRPLQRDILRNRVYAGKTQISLWSGWDNGIPTAESSPAELAPVEQENFAWPKWGQYFETGGRNGEPVDLPAAERLLGLRAAWYAARDTGRRAEIWREMLAIHADQQFVIGIIGDTLQPVAVSRRLRNVPAEAFYGWDPGAQFGIYYPDQFWLDEAGLHAAASLDRETRGEGAGE